MVAGYDDDDTPRIPHNRSVRIDGHNVPGTSDKVGHSLSTTVDGDFIDTGGSNEGFVWGFNTFLTLLDAIGLTDISGALLEAAVTRGGSFSVVRGMEAGVSLFGPDATAHVGQMESLRVTAPTRKDGATGGTVDRAYSLIVEAPSLGSQANFAINVEGGWSWFGGPIDAQQSVVLTSPAGNRYRLTVADDGTLGTTPA